MVFRSAAFNALVLAVVVAGCDNDDRDEERTTAVSQAAEATGATANGERAAPSAHAALGGVQTAGSGKTPTAAPSASSHATAANASSGAASSLDSASSQGGVQATAETAEPCPSGMLLIRGGEYWAGRLRAGGNPEEHPKHKTRVHDFCLDRTEVTTAAYERCVADSQCDSATRDTKTCNSGRERPEHPINCVTYAQAEAFCKARGARLPSELEWEYAARGGTEYRKFSWGDASPDGNTCWKRATSCPVATHTEGAFGLHDMNGNVWEWTSTWYGAYPWPASDGLTKVYRGGSWSRRFDKWMSLTLRNRLDPERWGSHLGFRCAALAPGAQCPYGKDENGACRHGVEDAECPRGQTWNGARCAAQGEPQCPPNSEFEAGRGCQGEGITHRVKRPSRASIDDNTAEEPAAEVTSRRAPRFDEDCARFNPTRPVAWRFEGGTHAARNQAGSAKGCKNRDVGVGWNSACCPN